MRDITTDNLNKPNNPDNSDTRQVWESREDAEVYGVLATAQQQRRQTELAQRWIDSTLFTDPKVSPHVLSVSHTHSSCSLCLTYTLSPLT